MVESIKGREEFYNNLVSSWSNDPETCKYFEQEVFDGRFKCKLDNPYSQDVLYNTIYVKNEYQSGAYSDDSFDLSTDDTFYLDERYELYYQKSTFIDDGEFYLPFVHYKKSKVISPNKEIEYKVNRLFLPLKELFIVGVFCVS